MALAESGSFVRDDEFIIAMDYYDRPMSAQDFVALAAGGIRTALRSVLWHRLVFQEDVIDWSYLDEFLERPLAAGLKVILVEPDTVPHCFPDDWYARKWDGTLARDFPLWSMFSPWHLQAQEYMGWLHEQIARHVEGLPVLLVRGGPHCGEALLPYDPYYHDGVGKANFRSWARHVYADDLGKLAQEEGIGYRSWDEVEPGDLRHGNPHYHPVTLRWLETTMRQQTEREMRRYSEQWFMLAGCWRDHLCSCNRLIDGLEADALARGPVNYIAYAHYNLGGYLQGLALQHARVGSSLWVGSQYCEGLITNTRRAIEDGVRGFITGPLCTEDNHTQARVEPWMVEAIDKSLATWRTVKGV